MHDRMKLWQRLLITALILFIIGLSGVTVYNKMHISPPPIPDKLSGIPSLKHPDKDFFTCGKNWCKKNDHDLWELYIEGEPYTRGIIEGRLTKELIEKQEEAFLFRLREMVPSAFYRSFLKYFIYWFNRDLDKNITLEDKQQIYGISRSASDRFSSMGSPYQRMLNYHSAHDIGHALVNMGMIGCTSFGVWNHESESGNLLIGRNFDFYMGDEFSENKIICFEKHEKGYSFMYVTWGGMIGVVSGMNEMGLTVTINAAKSEMPKSAKTPISLLAREILQYASDIPEAMSIARKRQIFVSESILVGSAKENRAVLLEKSPSGFEIVKSPNDYIICTNHFQSPKAKSDPSVVKDMKEQATLYRYRRVLQDITTEKPFTPRTVAKVLRDRSGLNGEKLGDGNEKAINQLIAHHAIIFEPATRRVWVSTNPWQLGAFVCYDICKIFHNFAGLQKKTEICEQEIIPEDTLLYSTDLLRFLDFKSTRKEFSEMLKSLKNLSVPDSSVSGYILNNPDYFEVYETAGDIYAAKNQKEKSIAFYRTALTKVVPKWKDKQRIIKKLVGCYRSY